MTGSPLIRIKNLSKSFHDVKALIDCSMTIQKGTMTTIVGPDGAGKTTLIRCVCGIIPPTSGSISIQGIDTVKDFEKTKHLIGYLSQNFTLYGDLTIDENIEFFAEIHGVKDYKKRRNELLEFTNLISFRKRPADKLSGGMKQKLALACALIHRPALLLLDEPTTGVDPVSRREFWIILAEILSEGITILMTTPYMDEAERSDEVGLLYQGALLYSGRPDELRKMLDERFIEIVSNDVWNASNILAAHPFVDSCARFGDRLHIATTHPECTIPSIRAYCKKEGIQVSGIRNIKPVLEDVFISLTQQKGE